MRSFEQAPSNKNQAEALNNELLIKKYVAYKRDVLSMDDLRSSWKFLRSIISGDEEKVMDEYLRSVKDEEVRKGIKDMEKELDNLLQEKGLADTAKKALKDSLKLII